MTVAAPDNRLHVVVGVIVDQDGKLLIQQRRAGTPRAGQWEFPGGKLEPGESPRTALTRELMEELGIDVVTATELAVITHDYDHARVWLDTWLITEFDGIAQGLEGQPIAWVDPDEIVSFDILEAVPPILEALASARSSAS